MRGDAVFRAPLISPSFAVSVSVLIGIVAELLLPPWARWQIVLVIGTVCGLALCIPRPGAPRVVVGASTIRARDASGESEAILLALVAVEWADDSSMGFRLADGDLFLVTRGDLKPHRWEALSALLREHLAVMRSFEDNPFLRPAT